MHSHFKNRFICPCTGEDLRLKVFSWDGDIIRDGLFFTSDKSKIYPLINSIPRIMEPTLLKTVVSDSVLADFVQKYKDRLDKGWIERVSTDQDGIKVELKARTANRYAYMWKNFDTNADIHDQLEFQRLTGGRLDFSKYKGKSVLDAGSGQGRFVYPILDHGAKEVVCLDLGESITQVGEKFKEDPRVLCVQGDITQPPLKSGFDLVMNIGVLQHLHDPAKGVEQLSKLVRPGGDLFIWCYGDSSIKKPLQSIRSIVQRYPDSALFVIAGMLAAIRYLIAKSFRLFRAMGLSELARKMPFGGYKDYSFYYFHANTFDHLSTVIINFFKEEELKGFLKSAGINNYRLIERFPGEANASWVIEATL